MFKSKSQKTICFFLKKELLNNDNMIDLKKDKVYLENLKLVKKARNSIKSYKSEQMLLTDLVTVLSQTLGDLVDIENEWALFMEIGELEMLYLARNIYKDIPIDKYTREVETGLMKILSALDAIEAGKDFAVDSSWCYDRLA